MVFFVPSSLSSPQTRWEQVTNMDKTIKLLCKGVMRLSPKENSVPILRL
jgi:hypothetical protein